MANCNHPCLLAITCCLLLWVCQPASNAQGNNVPPTNKKLIEFVWDTPDPQELHDGVANWQDRPFDGIVFTLSDNGSDLFNLSTYDPEKIGSEITLLHGLQWGRFTDNFVLVTFTSTMDWTSDADWKIVLAHAALIGKAAKVAHCQGFVFDPEPYNGQDPWNYHQQPASSRLSFEQYSAVVRSRGALLMSVLQKYVPNAKVLSFYQNYEVLRELGELYDDTARANALGGNGYGLMPSFFDGLLQAANSNIQFIDGDEHSYYYSTSTDFSNVYGYIHQNASLYVARDLRNKYNAQERAAFAVYTDYIYDLYTGAGNNVTSAHMTPDQRNTWFENNLYNGLNTSDEYVWLYSERLHWWPNEDPRPPGMEQAISDVKSKLDSSRPLNKDDQSTILGAKIQQILTNIFH